MKTATSTGYRLSSSVLTEEEQSLLASIRDNIRRNYFLIGDMANRKIAEANGAVPNQRIYDDIAKVLDISGRTVRYYAEIAWFYPHDVRVDYEVLSFTMFSAAKTEAHDLAEAEEILAFAAERVGRSTSAVIAEWRARKTAARVPYIASNVAVEGNGDAFPPAGAGSRPADSRGAVERVADVIGFVRRVVMAAPLPDEKKGRIGRLLEELEEEVSGLF